MASATLLLSGLLASSCGPPPATEEQAPGDTPAATQAPGEPLITWIEEIVPEEGPAPLTVKFTSEVTGGVPPYRYRWVFGDDTAESTEANPVHTYNQAGIFYPELYVTDATGNEDEDMDLVDVK